jgi:hypothetical protein
MSFSFDDMKPKPMAMPRMVSNELLGLGKDKPTSTVKASGASKTPEKKLTKKEQAKADAKKASSSAIASLLSKEPTVPRVRDFVSKRIKELTED